METRTAFVALILLCRVLRTEVVLVVDTGQNANLQTGVGAGRANISFFPLQPFTLCVRLNFRKLNIINIFAYINNPGRRPPLELQVDVDKFRIVVAGEYKYILLKSFLHPLQWYHFCVSHNASEKEGIKTYLSGHLEAKHALLLKNNYEGFNLTLGFLDPKIARGLTFIGNLTQFNIWSHILSPETIRDIAACKIDYNGNVVGWNDTNWGYQNAKLHDITLSNFCLKNNDEAPEIIKQETFYKASYICEGIGGNLMTPENLTSFQNLISSARLKHENGETPCSSFWVGIWDEGYEGVWRHHHDNSVASGYNWTVDEPNGGRYENCGIFNNNGIADDDCNKLRCSFCSIQPNSAWRMYGSCEDKTFKINYVLEIIKSEWIFRGYGDYVIMKTDDFQWTWKNSQNNETVAYLRNPKSGYPFGRQRWTTVRKVCDSLETSRIFLLSSCEENEFSCDDATCIAIEKRCNFQYDCKDNSDEVNCLLYRMPKDYKSSVTPRDSLNSGYLEVTPKLELESVGVVTNDMILEISFNLTLSWKDSRITFLNLKNDSNLNQIDIEKSALWMPSIAFTNTKNHSVTKVDKRLFAYAHKKSRLPTRDSSYPEIINLYPGAANPIVIHRKYQESFTCDFELSQHPFDSQLCVMKFLLRSGTDTIVRFKLESSTVAYSGSKLLIEYEIGEIFLETIIQDRFSRLQVSIPLKHRYGYAMINIYLPSIIMLIIGYLTLFFKIEIFEVRIMAALTTLLVMATLFTQVAGSLPKTSYFKMVDIWLLFCIFTTFIILVFHIIIDSMLQSDIKTSQDTSFKDVFLPSKISNKKEGVSVQRLELASQLISSPKRVFKNRILEFKVEPRKGLKCEDYDVKTNNKRDNKQTRQHTGKEDEINEKATKTSLQSKSATKKHSVGRFFTAPKTPRMMERFGRILTAFIILCFNMAYWRYIYFYAE